MKILPLEVAFVKDSPQGQVFSIIGHPGAYVITKDPKIFRDEMLEALSKEPFNKRLKERREQLGFSQRGLAERSGLTQAAISYLEKGESKPSRTAIESLLPVLGVDEAFFQ